MGVIKTKPTIANVSMPLANTEYSYELPDHTRKFSIKLRNPGVMLQVAFVQGASNTTYVNLVNGQAYTEENIKGSGNTLYFRTASTDQTAEIISYK